MDTRKRLVLSLIVFVSSIFSQELEIPEITVYGEKEIDVLMRKKSIPFFITYPDSFILKDEDIKLKDEKIKEREIKNFGFYLKTSIGSFDTSLVSYNENITFFAQNIYIPLLLDFGIKRDYKTYDYDIDGIFSFYPFDEQNFFSEYSKIKTDSVEEIFSFSYLFIKDYINIRCGLLTRNSNIYIIFDLNGIYRSFSFNLYTLDRFFPDSNISFSLNYDMNENFRMGISFKKYPLPLFTYLFPNSTIFIKSEFSKSSPYFLSNIYSSYFYPFFLDDIYRITIGNNFIKTGYALLFSNDSFYNGLSFSLHNPFIINLYYFFSGDKNIFGDLSIDIKKRFLFSLIFLKMGTFNIGFGADIKINEFFTIFGEMNSIYRSSTDNSFFIRTGLKIKGVF
uniref:DUF5723 domain-containing protein n=1 Tax=candidate division WOR-3 bacterium TaxID=2052148 RepID=A0A7C4U6K3_UNCW3